MAEGFKPIRDNILIKRLEKKDEKTPTGIIIPDTAKEKPTEGKVIEVGSGKRNKNGEITPVGVKKGDKVVFEKWAGKDIKINGEEYVVISEEEILAVYE